MAVNKYFNHYNCAGQQNVYDDLIVESIKMYGIDVKYLPRTLIKQDNVFGEDSLSKFENAVDIEMYMKNTTGFEGQGDFLSKFGVQIDDEITFVMARKRWDQIRTEKIIDEVGFNYQVEPADTTFHSNNSILLEAGTANGYSISSTRPLEGDLIFLPLNNNLYEIKFVEHEAIFYQHGQLYTYELTCDLFTYSSERIDTGNTVIDTRETVYTLDVLNHQFVIEDGSGTIQSEDGGHALQEFRIEDTDAVANNEMFTQSSFEYIDFSEQNPFSEIDRY